MTTAFVLGGGGVLGAVEVGMLRALFERDIMPDLVLGTSVGALNGAMVARDPSLAVIERLAELWPDGRPAGSRGVRRPPAAHGPAGGGDRHPHLLRQAAAPAAGRGVRRPRASRTCRSGSRCCAASIERAAEHWFDSGPLVDAVVASAAVPGLLPPGRGRRRALPRRRHRQLDPARRGPSSSAPTRSTCSRSGRIDRPLTVPRRPWEVARVSFEIARRHRFGARWPSCPPASRRTCCPPGGTSAQGRHAARATGTSAASRHASRRAYDARSRAYLADAALRPDRGALGVRRLVMAPVVVVLTVLIWRHACRCG